MEALEPERIRKPGHRLDLKIDRIVAWWFVRRIRLEVLQVKPAVATKLCCQRRVTRSCRHDAAWNRDHMHGHYQTLLEPWSAVVGHAASRVRAISASHARGRTGLPQPGSAHPPSRRCGARGGPPCWARSTGEPLPVSWSRRDISPGALPP